MFSHLSSLLCSRNNFIFKLIIISLFYFSSSFAANVDINPTLQQLTDWDLRGAMSIREGDRGQTIYVLWRQRDVRYYIHLSGPLGAGSVIIEGKPGSVTLKQSSPKRFLEAKSAEELLQSALGLKLPISFLYYWIRGISAPGPITLQEEDDNGRLLRLQQSGWEIDYQNYVRKNGVYLPQKMLLTYADLKIRIVVSNWQVTLT